MNKKLIIITLLCSTHSLVFGAALAAERMWGAPTYDEFLVGKFKHEDELREYDEIAIGALLYVERQLMDNGFNDIQLSLKGLSTIRSYNKGQFPYVKIKRKGERKGEGLCDVYFSRDIKGPRAAILPFMEKGTIINLPETFRGSLWGLNAQKIKDKYSGRIPLSEILQDYEVPLTLTEFASLCGGKVISGEGFVLAEVQKMNQEKDDLDKFDEELPKMCAKAIKDSEPKCSIQ